MGILDFEQSFDHEYALYGVKIAARRERILAVVSVKVEYFHFINKGKRRKWRTS